MTKNGEKTVTTYEYDRLGNRTAKTVDSVRTEYVNDITGSLTMVLCEITEESVATYAYGVRLNHTGKSENSIQYMGQQYDESKDGTSLNKDGTVQHT